MLTLFGNSSSGNCYKVRLALAYCSLDYRYVDLDSLHGATRQPAYLALNPFGKIPALAAPGQPLMVESNAIAWWLLRDTPLWPQTATEQQACLAWMFWEQYSHEPKVAVARSWVKLGRDQAQPEAFARLVDDARAALDHMERSLSAQPYLVGAAESLADLCLYAYTHKAGDFGLALTDWPGIHAWCQRLASQDWWPAIEAAPAATSLANALAALEQRDL